MMFMVWSFPRRRWSRTGLSDHLRPSDGRGIQRARRGIRPVSAALTRPPTGSTVEEWASRSSVRWPWTARDVSVRATVSYSRPWPSVRDDPSRRRAGGRALGRQPPGVGRTRTSSRASSGSARRWAPTPSRPRRDGYRLRCPCRRRGRPAVRGAGGTSPRAPGAGRGRPSLVPAGEGARAVAGPAFTDLAEWPPARREAGRLEELRLDAEELLLDAQLRGGHAREVLPQRPRDGPCRPVARTPLGAARPGPVPHRCPGRGAAHHPAAPRGPGS